MWFEQVAAVVTLVVATAYSVYNFTKERVSRQELDKMYSRLNDLLAEYRKAREDEQLTIDERLVIAEKAIALIEEVIKAYEQ